MNVSKLLNFILLLLCCNNAVAVTEKPISVGIIGDSYSTGFDLSSLELNDILNNKLELSQELLWPSAAEFVSPLTWMLKNIWLLLSRGAFDQEVIAWPMHLESNKIYNAAYDGATIRSIREQFYRIAQKTDRLDRLYIWFSLTDLCSGNLNNANLAEIYGVELLKLFHDIDLSKKLTINRLTLIPPINLGQLIHDEKILNKPVLGFATEANCKTIRSTQNQNSKAKLLSYFCPNVFVENDKAASSVATQVQSIRQALRKIVRVNKLNLSKKNIEIEYAESLESFVFTPEDIADDCLHLSKTGHQNLSKYLN